MKDRKIFDTHTHVYPDKIAARVVAHLQEVSQGIPAFTNGSYADHAKKSFEAGYTAWMNCPVVTKRGQAFHTNQWAAEHNHWPSLSLGGIHPDDEDCAGLVSQIEDLGLYGVKFHPEYQSFSPLEPRMEPLWEILENRGMRVLFHAGEDIGFQPPYHTTPQIFKELARRHPALKIVLAHFGGWKQWETVEDVLPGAGDNLYLDTSFTLDFLADPNLMTRVIRAMGADHVMFGTDSPWTEKKAAVEGILNLGLTEAELDAVFWNTAQSFWGFTEQ